MDRSTRCTRYSTSTVILELGRATSAATSTAQYRTVCRGEKLRYIPACRLQPPSPAEQLASNQRLTLSSAGRASQASQGPRAEPGRAELWGSAARGQHQARATMTTTTKFFPWMVLERRRPLEHHEPSLESIHPACAVPSSANLKT